MMASNRRYRLLCPIARGLDRVGDRWSLLILRDLHAGPARFVDLQSGLTGIAPNMLSDRLAQLADDGLVVKEDASYGVTLYKLTELGERTRDILFELAMFGGRFPPDEHPRKPGNLRAIAVTMGSAARRVATDGMDFEAVFRVDGEPFTLTVRDGDADMRIAKSNNPDLIVETSYESLLAVSEGEMPLHEFIELHFNLEVKTPGKEVELMALMSEVMAMFRGEKD